MGKIIPPPLKVMEVCEDLLLGFVNDIVISNFGNK
jgi:hypothetical protein